MISLMAALLCTAAPEGAAQVLLAPLQTGTASARAGQWVTYQVTTASGLTVFLRLAAVKDEPAEHAIWVEVEAGLTAGMESPLLQLALLCERDGDRLTGRVRRAFAAVAHEPAAPLPPALLAKARMEAPSDDRPPPADFRFRLGAPQDLATRAGRLTARPWELVYKGQVVKRMWMSDAVPLLHLARIEVPAVGQRIDLHDAGEGAEPRVKLPAARSFASETGDAR